MIKASHFGAMPDGRRVEQFTITNSKGLTLSVINYGAIVTQLLVPDRYGKLADIICGFNRLEPYLAGHPYFGCIAGRVAGRITRGRFTLDGTEYRLAINDPPNHLHGGRVGFDKQLWTVEETTDGSVQLSYFSADGEEGYPGNVGIHVTYSLTDTNEFVVGYIASCRRSTPLSLTHHGYFNLRGEGSGTIDDHILQIFADDYVPADEAMALLGRRESVADRANDFRKPKRVGDAIPGLWKQHGDVYFVNPAPAGEIVPVATLSEKSTGRVMTIRSTEPCLQLYTGVSLDGSIIGKSGQAYGKHGALCLECERYPDGVNHPELGDIILRPGNVYRQTTVHAFGIE